LYLLHVHLMCLFGCLLLVERRGGRVLLRSHAIGKGRGQGSLRMSVVMVRRRQSRRGVVATASGRGTVR
jgi:hypothetical protein